MSVNLQKGQKISLEKESGSKMSKVIMGLGWDVAKAKGIMGFIKKPEPIDLDASCVMFDASGHKVDVAWFAQLKSKDGSVVHLGDNRTGAGDGDDEQISVNLDSVPDHVTSLVFTVNSFTGQNFSKIENATCRIVNANNNQEVAKFNLSSTGSHTAQIMAKLYRHNGEWKMHAIGESGNGRTFEELIPQIQKHI